MDEFLLVEVQSRDAASIFRMLADDVDFPLCERLAPAPHSKQADLDLLTSGEVRVNPHPPVRMDLGQIDWGADPFDRNWRYSFHGLRWLDPALWGMAMGDASARDLWLGVVRSWVEQNPTDIAEDRPQAWANMIDGIRALKLVQAAPHVAKAAPGELPWLVQSMRTHMAWLADEDNLGHSNHALHQHEALFTLATVLGDAGLAELAVERLKALFGTHWSKDGMNAEGAIAYHHMNYLWWGRVVDVLEGAGSGAGAEFREVLSRVPVLLAHATRPDGTFVSIGDSDRGRPIKVDHPAAKWVVTGGGQGEPPSDNLLVHPDGYIFGRSGWGEFERHLAEETFFSLTFGRYKVHGHEDGGSLTYSAAQVNWIVDPGKYSYSHETAIRKHMVAHDSHSLTYLEGRKRSRNSPVELRSCAVTDETYDFTLVDRGYAGVEITRRVVYSVSGEYLVVMDTVSAQSDVTAVQRWQLGPEVDVESRGLTFDLFCRGSQAQLRFFGLRPEVSVVHHDGEAPNGLVATGWKQSAEAAVIEARRTSRALRFVTVMAPNHGRGEVTINLLKGAPPGAVVFEVDTGRVQEVISLTAAGARVLPSGVSPDSLVDGKSAPAGDRAQHLDADVRGQAFRLMADARATAWEAGPEEALRRYGAELDRVRHGLGSVDLGLAACLKDLQTGRLHDQRAVGPARSSLLNWGNIERWAPTRSPFPVVSHRGSLNRELVIPEVKIHTLDLGELVLPGVYIPGEAPVLTVLLHGAVDRSKTALPIFQRLTGQSALGVGHSLILSDPTLDLARSMRLGWYIGTESLDLHGEIARWLGEWCAALGAEHLVLSGSSGGGFAALQVGAFLPDSLVIPLSPQTDIREYLPSTQRQLYEAAFGLREIPGGTAARLSVAERIRSLGQSPRILYVQNVGDEMHVKRHALPLRAGLASLGFDSHLEYRAVDLGAGHKALDVVAYHELMTEVYGRMGYEARPR